MAVVSTDCSCNPHAWHAYIWEHAKVEVACSMMIPHQKCSELRLECRPEDGLGEDFPQQGVKVHETEDALLVAVASPTAVSKKASKRARRRLVTPPVATPTPCKGADTAAATSVVSKADK